jgi:CDP-glucose 4,6-dehydratase
LWLAAKLLQEGREFAEAWNFGPLEQIGVTAGELAAKLVELWGSGSWVQTHPELAKAETGLLRLSWEKSAARLDWRPVYTWEEALADIVAWFKLFQAGNQDMMEVGRYHIDRYVERAKELKPAWAVG